MADLSGRRLGDYELLSPIGRGGMAAVYQARHIPTGRIVAVKVLSPQVAENESFLLRFRREARVVKRLRHPHIVPVEDFGEVGDYAFLVMPYLSAGSLAERLAQAPLTPQEGGQIMGQICSALDHAHREGVVHRDVKPSNILLDEDGNSLLADFGLAQIHDASISLTGSALLGTPAYVSPEQVRGEAVDARSDQYSLGIVLYQLTTGQLPYEAETPMAVLLKQVNDPMPRPRRVNPNIPETVERVILKATAKDPSDRFPSMGALNAAFQAALAHALDPRQNPAPTIPLPPSVAMPRAASKRRRLQPWMLAAALLMLVACPAGVAFYGSSVQTPAAAGALDDSASRLTAAAATIDALSTQIVAARSGPISVGEVSTAAAATGTAAATLHATNTGPQTGATATTSGSATNLAAGAASATPSRTPTVASVTSGDPSSTPSPSSTGTRTETVSPTSIVPTITLTLFPTLTLPAVTVTLPVEPTSTVAPLACETSDFVGGSMDGQEVTVGLYNGGGSPIQITRLALDWPPANGELKKIELGGDTIWSVGDDTPPTMIDSDWDDPGRKVPAGQTEPLTFFFENDAQPSGYNLGVELNNQCTLTGAR